MKGKELKPIKTIIELLDGKHEMVMDFNTFQELENIYGDISTAFSKFNQTIKFEDLRNFICAAVNSAIEDESKHYTPFKIGKLLIINKIKEYSEALIILLNGALPEPVEIDEDFKELDEKN